MCLPFVSFLSRPAGAVKAGCDFQPGQAQIQQSAAKKTAA
jgi:hypothetical protein